MLSKRHWDLFSDNINKSEKKSKTKNKFNAFKARKLLGYGKLEIAGKK